MGLSATNDGNTSVGAYSGNEGDVNSGGYSGNEGGVLHGTGNSIVSEQTENFELGMGSSWLGDGAEISTISTTEENDNSVFEDHSDNSIFEDHSDNSIFEDHSDNSIFEDQSDNSVFNEINGVNLGDGAKSNTGVQLGENAAYTVNQVAMDDNTSSLVNEAMGLMYSNTKNALEAQAANNGGQPAHLSSPAIMPKTDKEPVTAEGKALALGAAGLVAAVAIYQLSKGRKAT